MSSAGVHSHLRHLLVLVFVVVVVLRVFLPANARALCGAAGARRRVLGRGALLAAGVAAFLAIVIVVLVIVVIVVLVVVVLARLAVVVAVALCMATSGLSLRGRSAHAESAASGTHTMARP